MNLVQTHQMRGNLQQCECTSGDKAIAAYQFTVGKGHGGGDDVAVGDR